MTNKRQTNGRKSVRWIKILWILLAALFVMRLSGQVSHYRALSAEAEQYREQLILAEEEYAAKLATIELLDNDAYIEREAREKLGMVKPGEIVVSTVSVDLPAAPAVLPE